MARATFEGPILSGDSRFGPLRNVGYTDLCQEATIVLTNTANGTAGYGGSSGQFVNGNGIPNTNAVVYTPSSSVYPTLRSGPNRLSPERIGPSKVERDMFMTSCKRPIPIVASSAGAVAV